MKPAPSSAKNPAARSPHPADTVVRHLALFRYRLRKFLRFSEQAARKFGVTPQQHQLLLGVAGYSADRRATISELAEFMQERHNSMVELVARAVRRGLVCKNHDTLDRRRVFVTMTPKGQAILAKLSAIHQQQVLRLRAHLLSAQESSFSVSGPVKRPTVRPSSSTAVRKRESKTPRHRSN